MVDWYGKNEKVDCIDIFSIIIAAVKQKESIK